MEAECRCVGSEVKTTGAAPWRKHDILLNGTEVLVCILGTLAFSLPHLEILFQTTPNLTICNYLDKLTMLN